MKNNTNEQEISLKEIILGIQEYIKYLWKNTLYILIPVFLLGGYMAYQSYKLPPKYTAARKFFVEGQGSSGGMGGLGGLLGSIGIKQGKSNPFQLLEVADSKLLVAEVLLTKVGEDQDFLGNVIINEYKLDEEWGEDNEVYIGLRFTHDSLEIFNNNENIILNRLIGRMISSEYQPALRKVDLDEDRGYYEIVSETKNQTLSLAIDEISYEKIRYYFEEKVMRSYIENRNILKLKADSINYILKSKINELASFLDSNRGSTSFRATVKANLLKEEINSHSVAFGEVTKSYEMADYSMRNQKPTFMLIDRPFPPLSYSRSRWSMGFLKGGILGGMLAIGFFILRKIYTDAMNDKETTDA